MFEFSVEARDGAARVGSLVTPHGNVTTPCFMPVGTHGAVKGVSAPELLALGSQIVLGNTYHLYLKPGDAVIRDLGGLHKFTTYSGPMLTDSGGFQAFSLGERGIDGHEKQTMRSVTEDGVTFKSHHDGSKHLFTPEKSITIQHNLGADIIMAFDQPVYGMSNPVEAKEAMQRSMRWLDRSVQTWKELGMRTAQGTDQALFGIVQGGVHKDLHTESAQAVVAHDLPGNAIGGLAVGETKPDMWKATESIVGLLPDSKPRYFMGLGEPTDLVQATLRGIDIYDCVAPTRLGRHGVIWQLTDREGEIDSDLVAAFWSGDTDTLLKAEPKSLCSVRWNLTNAKFREDPALLLPSNQYGEGSPFLPLSRALLYHYVKFDEMLGYRVLSMHNIALLHRITEHMRNAIRLGSLDRFANLW